MNILENLPTLSIAELRKVLSDNDIKDTSQSKGDLVQQVTEYCLTKITIDEIEQEIHNEHQESIELSRGIEDSRIQADRELLDIQQQEYERCLQNDLVSNIVNDIVSEIEEEISEGRELTPEGRELTPEGRELTPEEVREIRLQRFA